MEPLLLVVGAVACALAVAWLLGGRASGGAARLGLAGRAGNGASLPALLDRRDFARPDAPWLVAVFTSASCDTCGAVVAKARLLDCEDVAVCELEVGEAPEIHRRYRIDAVPLVIAADAEGVARRWFVGPVASAELWAALAELRQG